MAYKGRKEVRNLQVNVGGGKDVRDYEEEKSEKTKWKKRINNDLRKSKEAKGEGEVSEKRMGKKA